MKRHFKEIREAELESTSAPANWEQARGKRFKQYDELVKSVCKVDTQRLSDEDRKLLLAVIYEEIPAAAELVGQEAISYWHTMNNNVSTYSSKAGLQFASLSESVLEIVKKQRNPQYESATALEETNAALMELSFPQRSFSDTQISAALTKLEQAWNLARQRNLSAEESYTVHALATSYLPDTWRAIKGFETFPEEACQKVEQHVLEQLTLLQEQMEAILRRNVEASLGALEAQTYFLREKQKHAKSSGLKLLRRR